MPIVLKMLVLNEVIELNPKFLKIFDDFYDIGLQVFLFKGIV
jgi:hypothetical protein